MDPVLLWLWCSSAAAAPVQLLAWELPNAMGEALKKKIGRGMDRWKDGECVEE